MRASWTRSATFRLSLLATPLYLLAGWVLLAFVYANTEAIIDRRVNLGLTAERARLVEDLRGAGTARIVEMLRTKVIAERGSARLYRLADSQGRVLAGNFELPAGGAPPPGAFAHVEALKGPERAPVAARLLTVPLAGDLRLVLGRDLAEEEQFRLVIEETLAIAMVLTALLAVFAGAVTSRMVLARLGALGATADRLLHGDLRERMPVSGSGDEFDQLAGSVNEALDRISQLMAATRQVTDNIAHDLRGPLARTRNRLELALVTDQPRDGLAEAVAASVDDVDGVLATCESLLSIARLEHGVARDFAPLDLAPLIEDLVDYFQPLAEEKGLDLATAGVIGGTVNGDRNLLFQALSNVVDNAIRYTPAGGHIRVTVEATAAGIAITVADDGPGIPADHRDKVLQRFVRLDSSRHLPGNGLGLAVVDAVAHHHRAALVLSDNRPGLAVTLVLPAAAHRPDGQS